MPLKWWFERPPVSAGVLLTSRFHSAIPYAFNTLFYIQQIIINESHRLGPSMKAPDRNQIK